MLHSLNIERIGKIKRAHRESVCSDRALNDSIFRKQSLPDPRTTVPESQQLREVERKLQQVIVTFIITNEVEDIA
jgi:hypothetical protein